LKRALLFLAGIAACVFGYVFLISLLRGRPAAVSLVAPAFLTAVAAAALNRIFFRLEGESMASIGFSAPAHRLGQFAVAFVGGCVLVLGWAAILAAVASPRWRATGGVHFRDGLSRVAFCLFNNGAEELAYRGYLLWKLAQRLGSTAAVLSTSILFALLHVQGGVPLASAMTIVLTSAVLLGVLVLRWRSLPLAIGFHVALNIAQEALGLRTSALSFVQPAFPAGMTSMQRAALLALPASLNLVIAWLVWRNGRRGREADFVRASAART